jgi:CRP/FNR family cyclic AMP-dependent transcriptional regulator
MTILDTLPTDVVDDLRDHSITRDFRRGDTLVYQGDPSATVYYMSRGHAAVKVGTPHGETVTVALLSAGDSFGELAHLTGREERTASVVALDDVQARIISEHEFQVQRTRHPEIGEALLTVLAARIDDLSERLAQSIYESVQRRCARRLLEAALLFREGEPDTVSVPITQDDLAGLAGASRPTVNQVLGQLTDSGIVKTSRGSITVVSMVGLTKFAR